MKELLQKQFDLKTVFQNWDVFMPKNLLQWVLLFCAIFWISDYIVAPQFNVTESTPFVFGIASIPFFGSALYGIWKLKNFSKQKDIFFWSTLSFLTAEFCIYQALFLFKPVAYVTATLLTVIALLCAIYKTKINYVLESMPIKNLAIITVGIIVSIFFYISLWIYPGDLMKAFWSTIIISMTVLLPFFAWVITDRGQGFLGALILFLCSILHVMYCIKVFREELPFAIQMIPVITLIILNTFFWKMYIKKTKNH